MGKPAATHGHYHFCPQYNGDTPHVGGPVDGGSSNVSIAGQPAARAGDKLICTGGGTDTITEGSATVTINGRPAARMGDKTAHSGVILAGEGSVLIGDKSFRSTGGSTPQGKVTDLARRSLSRIMVCQKNGQPTICDEPVCPCKGESA
ncbi:PAAR domain-containing protein [Pokkaliibacter plantistimulans]|uniref:PAAR domain-containing protein n=1 Tax=Pokkaliibacter plantistimulans TaxID=1635171 RepID=UPI000D7465AE|nr:PAAR domain-containing protein [Pokkaliibacter plantistimulans]